LANIINAPIIIWKTDISLVGYVVCAVYVPEGLHSFQSGVSVHLDGNAFNCLLCFDKIQYESKVVSIMQNYFSKHQVNDLELMDMSIGETSDEDSIQFEKKGSINCKINNLYGYSNCNDSILSNIISDKVSFFDVIKTDKHEISAGNYIVLSKRFSCEFVFFGVMKVAPNKRRRLPKYYNLVFNSNEGNKLFSFSISQLEKKIESPNFRFEKTHITLLLSTASKFATGGLNIKIPHYIHLGNYLVNVNVKKNRM
jgi:hypothetical protein